MGGQCDTRVCVCVCVSLSHSHRDTGLPHTFGYMGASGIELTFCKLIDSGHGNHSD